MKEIDEDKWNRENNFGLPKHIVQTIHQWALEEQELFYKRYEQMIKKHDDEMERAKAEKNGIPHRKYKKKPIKKIKHEIPPIPEDLRKQIMADGRRIRKERRQREKKLKKDPKKYSMMKKMEEHIKSREIDNVTALKIGEITLKEFKRERERIVMMKDFYGKYVENILAEK